MDLPRRELRAAIEAGRHSLRDVSLMIGRNEAYLQQYLERGSPRRLNDLDRRHLAIYLNVDEMRLGAREPWRPVDVSTQPTT